jgi:hypothetical protein
VSAGLQWLTLSEAKSCFASGRTIIVRRAFGTIIKKLQREGEGYIVTSDETQAVVAPGELRTVYNGPDLFEAVSAYNLI